MRRWTGSSSACGVPPRRDPGVHEDSPLWDDLDVVENDAVFTVGNHWEFGGAVAARRVIADIGKALDTFAARNGGGTATASPEPTT